MKVQLKKLKPNPMRDFIVDPINEEQVATLADSIRQYEFWGGVVVRKCKNGDLEIAAGQHRVAAAMKAGAAEADLTVLDHKIVDDDKMFRIYATENATQRGNKDSSAYSGIVAGAVERIARWILFEDSNNSPSVRRVFTNSQIGHWREAFEKDGIGRVAVEEFCEGIPINKTLIDQQLQALKASKDYDRIVGKVIAEFEKAKAAEIIAAEQAEAEAKEAEAEKERAKQKEKAAKELAEKTKSKEAKAEAEAAKKETKAATDKVKKTKEKAKKTASTRTASKTAKKAKMSAEQREKTFDLVGVQKIFPVPKHLATYRRIVIEDYADIVPVENQAKLAEEIVRSIKAIGEEVSSDRIRTFFMIKMNEERWKVIIAARRDKERRQRTDLAYNEKTKLDAFMKVASALTTAGLELASLYEKWPANVAHQRTRKVNDNIERMLNIAYRLYLQVFGWDQLQEELQALRKLNDKKIPKTEMKALTGGRL